MDNGFFFAGHGCYAGPSRRARSGADGCAFAPARDGADGCSSRGAAADLYGIALAMAFAPARDRQGIHFLSAH